MDYTERYTTQAGKQYLIKLNYNEKIQEREGFGNFLRSLEVLNPDKKPAPLPINVAAFSTYEQLTSFGSYASINYQGVREAAMEGLRLKILTRVQDYLESIG